MIRIEEAKKMKRSGQIRGVAQGCSRFRQRESGGDMTDVRAIAGARKRALASLCIFQETRVRRAAVK